MFTRSFDTFISYTTNAGLRGGVGIEVKYTEEGYKIGTTEEKVMGNPSHPYALVTKASGYFLDPDPKTFKGDDLRQIWRNHILGAAMISNGDLDVFHCIHLYPKKNTHFDKIVIPQYIRLLTKKGTDSFIGLTYEELFCLMGKYFNSPQESDWLDYLKKRYLF